MVLVLLLPLFGYANNGALNDTLIVTIEGVKDVTCPGGSDGSIALLVEGTPPFLFQWSNGETTQNVSDLPAGLYDVVVEDSSGEQVLLEGIEVNQPDELLLTFDVGAYPGCDGSLGALTVEVSGGTPGYTYLWNSGQTENSIDGLEPGDYEVIVTDENGCTATASISLQPKFPVAAIESSGHITCIQSTVTLDGSASSAGGDFTFLWSAENGGEFSAPTDTLVTAAQVAGTYSLEITDLNNGCVSVATVEIEEDTLEPVADAGDDIVADCTNSTVELNGSAANGSNFGFAWEALDGGQIASGENTPLPTVSHAGTFVLTVTNLDNGCTATDEMVVTGANEPPSASVEGGELNCFLPQVQLLVVADTDDKVYKWSGPNGFSSDELEPLVAEEGEYVFTITDTLTTCTASFSTEVFDNTAAPALTVEGGILTCAVQSVELVAFTSTPDAIFEWTGPNGFNSNEQNPEVNLAGDYVLLLTDTLTGCSATETAVVEDDTDLPIADAGPDFMLTCASPVAQLDGSASSQGDFTYEWTTSTGNIVSGAETLTPEVNAPGIYTLTVLNNANGCVASDEAVVVSDVVTPVVEAIGGEVSCFEPEVQIFGIFDTDGVTFGWEGPNGFTSDEQDPIVTAPGDYVLTVTDTLTGCSASAVAVVTKLGVDPILTTTGGTITCANPTVQLTVEAQIGDILWSWAGENGFQSTEQNPVVTEPGLYFVLAIDAVFGCIALDTAIVAIDTEDPIAEAGPGLSFDCFITSATLDGSASSQGPEFTYLWTTTNGNIAAGETTLFPFVDVPGTYTLTVTNTNNGCTAESEVVVSQFDPVTADAVSEDVLCFNTATGAAVVTAGGGDGNYTYAWSSGSTQATATGLVAGSYTVTVTDGNGCTAEDVVFIGQPDLLHANASGTGQSLANVDDGSVTAEPTGGTAPYSYEWSNGGTNQTLTDLAPGAYTVTVTDANGCTAIETANVNEFPCVLTASVTGTPASCHGAADGEATVTVENEVDPVTYEWSNGETASTATGLSAGIYAVTVTDGTNCSNTLTVLIGQPSEIIVSELFHVDVTCPDETIGFVIVGATGGVQPYSFEWSNGSTGNIANGLGIGGYALSVTDGTGCVQVYTTTIVATDAEPPLLALQDVTVFLDEYGTATVTADQFDAGIADNCGLESITVSPDTFDCSHIGEQTVTITATDVNGNVSIGTAIVTVADDQAPVLVCPGNLTVSACNATVDFDQPEVIDNCDFDPASLVLTEGLPSGSAFPVGITVQTFVYTDAAGNTGECSFDIELLGELETAFVASDASCADLCDGGIGLILIGGVSPYQIEWSNGETTETITDLCAGVYTATVTDASGCEATIEVEITEPEALDLDVVDFESPLCPGDPTGVISIAAFGGTAPYSYEWSNGETGETLTDIIADVYEVSVTDANGCQLIVTLELEATDDEAPELVLQDVTISLDDSGNALLDPALFDAGSSDNCGIVFWAVSPANFDCTALGDQQVTIFATDANGNTTSGTATVTIVDDIAPALTCPSDIVAGFCNATVMFVAPQIADNCPVDPANLVLTEGLPSGSAFPVGATLQAFAYTDASGNTGTCTFTVTVLEPATVTGTGTGVSCAGACDGTATLTIAGGAQPFTIAWSNGQSGLTASGLCAGTVSASVTDAAGCLYVFTTTIAEPAALVLTIDQVTNDQGGAGVGSIQITVTGGVPPYTYNWTRNGAPFATTQDLTNLGSGQYAVVVTDANNCQIASQNIVVDNITGTVEAAWANSLSILPNPASDRALLKMENPLAEAMEVRLFDAVGKMALGFKLERGESSKVLDLSALQPGFYSVQLVSAGSVAVRRLVISR